MVADGFAGRLTRSALHLLLLRGRAWRAWRGPLRRWCEDLWRSLEGEGSRRGCCCGRACARCLPRRRGGIVGGAAHFAGSFAADGRWHRLARTSAGIVAQLIARSLYRISSTLAITAEAAWHRRARRLRQQARGLLAVDRARRILAAHHGGGMPQHASLPPWTCMVCGVDDNWGHKARCRRCGAYPPSEHRKLQKGTSKGSVGGGKGGGKGNSGGKGPGGDKGSNLGSYAFRQLQRASLASRTENQPQSTFRTNKELQDARRRADQLNEANKKLQRELAEARSANVQGQDDDMDWEGPEEMDEDTRKARIEKIRGGLPYLEENFGTSSEIYRDAQEELEMHQRAIRESKPYKTHRTILERRVEKLQKLQERDREKLVELNESADEIEEKIKSTTQAIVERGRELETAETELKELLLRAVGEDQQTPAATDPQQGWDAVVGSVAALVRQPGVPAPFTRQLEDLFEQLRGMVTQLQQHAAANDATGENPTGKTATNDAKQQSHQSTTYAQAAKAASSSASASSTSAAAAATSAAAGNADELRRRQRRARQQMLQTEAIAEYEKAYRAQLQKGKAGGQDDGQMPPPEMATTATTLALPATTCQPTPTAPPVPTAPTIPVSDGDAGGTAGGGGGSEQQETTKPVANDTAAASAAVETSATVWEQPELDTDVSDAASDITGTLSDGDRDHMEIDKVVASIPKEQREKVRSMLEGSRIRRARQLQRRRKKPLVEETGVPRNPKK